MEKSIIIFGNSPFSKMIKYYIETYTSSKVFAFTVDSEYKTSDSFCNLPVISFENINSICPPNKYDMIIAIGSSKMSTIRKEKMDISKNLGYFLPNFIHPTVHMENTDIGYGNIILENTVLSYKVKIGNGNILWNGCNISHESRINNYNYIAPSVSIAGRTTICNNCFLGINSCIKDNLTIADYSLIGAGCYINQNTEKNSIYVPARTQKIPNKVSLDIDV